MAVWGVRTRNYGEQESLATGNGVALIGWQDTPGISALISRGLLKAVLANYDALPADVQAALPLKRVWALVPTDTEG